LDAVKKFATIILLVPFAVAGGLFYGLIADKLFKGREPWFTLFMLVGLAASVSVMTWLCSASVTLAIWVFIGTSVLYLISRVGFGKGSALEMFYGPHFIALMILLLQPALARAHEKARMLQEQRPNTALEPTGDGAGSSASRSTSSVAGGSAFGR
jgi:hypothetical protein